MAKPYNEINKTEFRKNYNIVRILTDINDIMNELKSFNSNNQAIAVGVKKKHQVTLEDLMDEIKLIKTDIKSINVRLDKVDARLDKHDEMFKAHGWIK